MNRRDALRALAAGLLGPGLARAQPAGGMARIGFLANRGVLPETNFLRAMQQQGPTCCCERKR